MLLKIGAYKEAEDEASEFSSLGVVQEEGEQIISGDNGMRTWGNSAQTAVGGIMRHALHHTMCNGRKYRFYPHIICCTSSLSPPTPILFRAQDGGTALMRACENGHLEVVKALLFAGADKEAEDKVSARGVGV